MEKNTSTFGAKCRHVWNYFSTYEKIWFFSILILACVFAVLFPEDAHAPGICLDAPAHTRKCVFKVRL